MKKIIAILLILILGFTFSGYSSITFMASEADGEITDNPVTEEPIEEKPIEEIEEPPIEENPEEKIETKTYNYISETEIARLHLKTDNTCVLETLDPEGKVYATVNGTYEVLEENKIEIYVYAEDEKELFGTFVLNEEDMSFDWYEEIVEPPVVDEPEEPTEEKSELAIWFEDKVMPYLLTFITAFLGTGVVGLILRKLVKTGLSAANNALATATNKLKLSEESNKILQEASKVLNSTVESKLNDYIEVLERKFNEANQKLIELQNTLYEEQTKYIEAKNKAITLSEKLINTFGDDDEKTSQDNNS